jgi:hypothetical protein
VRSVRVVLGGAGRCRRGPAGARRRTARAGGGQRAAGPGPQHGTGGRRPRSNGARPPRGGRRRARALVRGAGTGVRRGAGTDDGAGPRGAPQVTPREPSILALRHVVSADRHAVGPDDRCRGAGPGRRTTSRRGPRSRAPTVASRVLPTGVDNPVDGVLPVGTAGCGPSPRGRVRPVHDGPGAPPRRARCREPATRSRVRPWGGRTSTAAGTTGGPLAARGDA